MCDFCVVRIVVWSGVQSCWPCSSTNLKDLYLTGAYCPTLPPFFWAVCVYQISYFGPTLFWFQIKIYFSVYPSPKNLVSAKKRKPQNQKIIECCSFVSFFPIHHVSGKGLLFTASSKKKPKTRFVNVKCVQCCVYKVISQESRFFWAEESIEKTAAFELRKFFLKFSSPSAKDGGATQLHFLVPSAPG